MRKIVIFAMAIALAASPAIAETGHELYASGSLQAVFTGDSDVTISRTGAKRDINFDNGAGGAIALGYFINPNMRLEAEANYRKNEVKIAGTNISGNIDSMAYMLNGLYDFALEGNIKPYLGAGIGMVDIDGKEDVFAYQGIVGASYKISDDGAIFSNYKYFIANNVDYGLKYDYQSQNIEIGYRHSF